MQIFNHYKEHLNILGKLALFEDLDFNTQHLLAQKASLITLSAQKNIIQEFPLADKIYLLGEGKIFLSCIEESGRKIIIDNLKEGNIFGNLDLLNKTGQTNPCLFIEPFPKTSAKILSFKREDFLEILLHDHLLSLKLISEASERVHNLEKKIEELAFFDLRVRLLSELVRLGEVSSVHESTPGIVAIRSEITHEKLAETTGSVRETVSKTLAKLKREGLVFYDRNKNLIVRLIRRKR